MELLGKRVLVVGLGKSGLAAVRLLRAHGAVVLANDAKPEEALGDVARAVRESGAELVAGTHPEALFTSVDRIVVSPGVPKLDALAQADARGIPIASEIELASWFVRAPLIGVTGTNGKSTVTSLVGAMCAALDRAVFVGGNLGTPLVEVVGTPAAEREGLVVAELSSFQLERVEQFRAHVAVLLNVTDDHLDRHGTFAAYAAAKGRIFHRQREGDHAVVPATDALCLALARAGRAELHTFGGADGEVRIVDDAVVDVVSGLRVPLRDLKLRGAHNALNACAAVLTARLAGVPAEKIANVLRGFAGLPHRMAHVRELDGVAYYDDSKATNVGAAVAALDGLAGSVERVVLIAGGVDKGGSYMPLAERLAQLGRGLVLIGDAAPLLAQAVNSLDLPVRRAASMDAAVLEARALARPGDAVLLAPACASFDMFRSYAHRGDEFVRAVQALPEVPA